MGCSDRSFFSGWGIRTVAKGEARYNPMSYHNGSIWPHDNALIALGFARYGLKRAVTQTFKGLFDAATYMDLRRLPELFCGFQRQRGRGPTLYPVACAPQAWASATPFTPDRGVARPRIRSRAWRNSSAQSAAAAVPRRDPLRNLQLDDATVDLRFGGITTRSRWISRARAEQSRFPPCFRPDRGGVPGRFAAHAEQLKRRFAGTTASSPS